MPDLRNPFIILAMALGGVLSRYHGGGIFRTMGKVWKGLLWSAPFGIVTGFVASWWAALPVWILTAAAKNTGHGQYFSLATVWKYIEPERIDPIVQLVFGPDERCDPSMKDVKPQYHNEPIDTKLYWRCVFGLAVKGVLTALPAALCLGWVFVPSGLITLLGGALLPVGYMIGWALFPGNLFKDGTVGKATATGEVIGGTLAFLSCAISVFLVF